MSNEIKNTFETYLGPEFQLKLMWQLLVEPEFCKNVISNIAVEYFDDPYLKRLFIIMYEYYKENEKVANLQNGSIEEAIQKYKSPTSEVEGEVLRGKLDQIKLWNERVINKNLLYDGDVVRKETVNFIKQQEYRKLGETIIKKVKTGEIKKTSFNFEIEERINKIYHIGDDEDDGCDVLDNIEDALSKEFRETIPTGIEVIDTITGNGLGKGEVGLILAPSGVGKALPNSHKVLTPNGWVENGNLKINDFVIGSDGKKQKVLGVYPQGKRKIYKIDFSDNTSSYCDLNHLWAVNSLKQREQKTKINDKSVYFPDLSFQTLKTSEMINDYKINGKLNYRLPNVMPVEFNEIDIPINPYIMGILLGDGCLTRKNQPHFITSDVEIKDYCISLNENISVSKYKGRYKKYKDLYRVNLLNSRKVLDDELSLYGTDSSTKFIPRIYLYNSVENRIKLLQGLIDSDGTVGKNNAIIYTTISKKLSNDVRELVLSLGGSCSVNTNKKTYKNKLGVKLTGKLSYSLTISFPDNGVIPCTLPRKLERFKPRSKYIYNKYIKNIEYSHEEEATCIYVENMDHLYVIDDYILTHNTTFLTKIANSGFNESKKVLHIIFEDTVRQVQRKHYANWSKIKLSDIDDNVEEVKDRVVKHVTKIKKNGGKLDIVRFIEEETSLHDIKNWISRHEKKFGYKYDMIVLDYLDCLEPNRREKDLHAAELSIIKSFIAMAAEYDIPCWAAIQTNRSGFNIDFVEAHHTGGNIKRVQKSHFVMSVSKPDKTANLANIKVLKARFAQDGHEFKDCIFNNDTQEIRITGSKYASGLKIKHIEDEDIDKIENKIAKLEKGIDHGKLSGVVYEDGETIGDLKLKSGTFENNEDIKPDENFSNEGVTEGANNQLIDSDGLIKKKSFEFKSPGVSYFERDSISELVPEESSETLSGFDVMQFLNTSGDDFNKKPQDDVNNYLQQQRNSQGDILKE